MKKANILIAEEDRKNLNMRLTLTQDGAYSLKTDSDKFGGVLNITVETIQINAVCIEDKYYDLKELETKFTSVYSRLCEEVATIRKLKFFDEAYTIKLSELFQQLTVLQNSCSDKELFEHLIWDSASGGFYININKYLPVLTVIHVHNFMSYRNFTQVEIRQALQFVELQEIYDKMQLS